MEDVVLTRTWYGDMINGKPAYFAKTVNDSVAIMVICSDEELFNVHLESPQYKENKMYWGLQFDVMQWIADECNVRLHIEGEVYFPSNYEESNEDVEIENIKIDEEK